MKLDHRFRGFRAALLASMAALTHDTDPKEIARVNGTWKRYRSETERFASEPGEAEEHHKALFATPEWRNFANRRRAVWKGGDAYREQQREYMAVYYRRTLSSRRRAAAYLRLFEGEETLSFGPPSPDIDA